MKTAIANQRMGHVGHTNTQDDAMRILETITWLLEQGQEIPNKKDFIELNKGRDFLKETKQYDIIILHFLFRGGFYVPAQTKGQLATSPLNSWYNWRRRLVQTGAKYIFAFGGASEVSGTFIVNLDGYKVHQVRTDAIHAAFSEDPKTHQGLWVFEKL